MFNKKFSEVIIRFGHIWILKLSEIVGEYQEYCHLIGVQTLLMRTTRKIKNN
jgi:hypothetical protein